LKTSVRVVAVSACAMVTASLLAGPAFAQPTTTTLYAYANGAAASPTSCPDVGLPAAATGCSFGSALQIAHQGDTIDLATPASTASYGLTYQVGLLSTTQFPLTIQTDPALTENAKLVGDQTGGTILTVATGVTLILNNLTFSNSASAASPPAHGGAINNAGGSVTINNCTFANNTAVDGGAIDNGDGTATSSMTINHSSFSGNVSTNGGTGGAIDNGDNKGTGQLAVDSSTFTSNRTVYDGGAIDSGDDGGLGSLLVTNSTFVNNLANTNGGAIDSADYGGFGFSNIRSSTFVGNTVTGGNGGAIDANASSHVIVSTSTLVGNTNTPSGLPDAIFLATGGTLYLAGNIIGDSCTFQSSATDLGFNLLADSSCSSGVVASDQISSNVPTQLGNLASNGGPVQTVRPVFWSAAVGLIPSQTSVDTQAYGPIQLCPRTDARAVNAVATAACAAGAVDVFKQPALAVTSLHGKFGTPLPLTFSGGAGTSTPVFANASGSTASGCAIGGSSQKPTLTSTSIGTCEVIVRIDADSQYQAAVSNQVPVLISPVTATAPRDLVASPRDKAARVDWSAPTATGGTPLTGYTVTATPLTKGGAHRCMTTATSCTITGLVNKVAYKFSVVARNAVGDSPAATTGPVIAGSPAAPRIRKVAPLVKGKSVVISWSAPALTNGSPVTAYEVAWSTNGGKSFGRFTAVGKSTSVVRAGLSKQGRYAIEVRAVNAAGPGASAERSFTSNG